MKKVLTLIIIFFHSTTAIAQEAPSCPNRGSDPSQFCLPGMTWDNESKKCVTLVWLLLPNLLIYLRFFRVAHPMLSLNTIIKWAAVITLKSLYIQPKWLYSTSLIIFWVLVIAPAFSLILMISGLFIIPAMCSKDGTSITDQTLFLLPPSCP